MEAMVAGENGQERCTSKRGNHGISEREPTQPSRDNGSQGKNLLDGQGKKQPLSQALSSATPMTKGKKQAQSADRKMATQEPSCKPSDEPGAQGLAKTKKRSSEHKGWPMRLASLLRLKKKPSATSSSQLLCQSTPPQSAKGVDHDDSQPSDSQVWLAGAPPRLSSSPLQPCRSPSISSFSASASSCSTLPVPHTLDPGMAARKSREHSERVRPVSLSLTPGVSVISRSPEEEKMDDTKHALPQLSWTDYMSSPVLLVSKAARMQRRHTLSTTHQAHADADSPAQSLKSILKKPKACQANGLVAAQASAEPADRLLSRKNKKKRRNVTFRAPNRSTDIHYFTDDEDSRECRRGYETLSYFASSLSLDDEELDAAIDEEFRLKDMWNFDRSPKSLHGKLRRDSFTANVNDALLERHQRQFRPKSSQSYLLRDSSSDDIEDEEEDTEDLDELFDDSEQIDCHFRDSSMDSFVSSSEKLDEQQKKRKKWAAADTAAKEQKGALQASQPPSHHHRRHQQHDETRKNKEKQKAKH